MINHTIALDMRKRTGTTPQRLTMRRGESQTQKITAALTDNGTAYTPTYQSARLCLLHADGTWARCSATVGTASVTATLASDMLNGAGRCRLAYFEFYSSNGYSETTENFELVILRNIDGTTDPAKSYDDELDALYKKWSEFEQQAETQESSRVSAEAGRASAETSRVNAETVRAQAESSRAQAESSRVNAETARAQAETSRVNAEEKRVSEHKADQEASASAAGSANTAADKANSAATAATTAAGKADTATSNANAATTKAAEAASSATDAAGSANSAADKANSAATAATTAAGKADTATSNANAATTKAAEAASSATDAAGSANSAAAAAIAAAAEARGSIVPVYDEETGRYTNTSIASWLMKQRDGKIYGVSIPKGSATACTKTGANAGIANPVPGVIGTPAVDPYVGMGCFQFYEVNGGVEEDGMPYVTAINGDGRFSRNEDTFIMTMSLYTLESETDDAVELSVSDSKNSGMQPQPGAYLPDGSLRPYMLYAKYALSVDSDGKPRSVSGQPVKRFISHDTGVTLCDTATTGYSFRNSADDWYVKAMFLLKYATKNSQSVFAGCTSHSEQASTTAATDAGTTVTVANSKVAKWPVGSWVMVGSSTAASLDRGNAAAHDLVDSAPILSKTVDGDNCILTLDCEPFSADAGVLVSTCPWGTGGCDAVEGDGSPTSCTSSREPFSLQGIELGLGMYEVIGNVLLYSTGTGWGVYVNPDTRDELKGAKADTAVNIGTFPGPTGATWNYGLYPHTVGGLMMQQGTGASSSTGICDGNYKNADTATGYREWLSLGHLASGGTAGLWCVGGYIGTSYAIWFIGSRLSVNGRQRGEAA